MQRRLSEKLQLVGIAELMQESLALHEMVCASGGDLGASGRPFNCLNA